MGDRKLCSFGCLPKDGCAGACKTHLLANAYDLWVAVEAAYVAFPTVKTAETADEALEALSALAYQNGYEPNGSLGLTEWVVREIAE